MKDEPLKKLKTRLLRKLNDICDEYSHYNSNQQGDILIFLPNIADAFFLKRELYKMKSKVKYKVVIWTDYLQDTTVQRNKELIEKATKKGYVKIVMTDIISDSLSLFSDKYDYVLDSGYHTSISYELKEDHSHITVDPITRNIANQRATFYDYKEGFCNRFYSFRYYTQLQD